MSRIAIIGSCITRDLWPILGETPQNLLYVSRTSLASLFAPAPAGVTTDDKPPNGLRPQPHAALVADLRKTALAALIAHRPTHIIFDFIDERFDLLAAGGGLVARTWELEVSGYLDQALFRTARAVPRASQACDRLWAEGAAEMAAFLQATPLREATVILHEAQWAQAYLDRSGATRQFEPTIEVLPGRFARLDEQNALLRKYQRTFARLVGDLARLSAPDELRFASERHRWGLSPFHYVDGYYRKIWDQLRDLGI
ncbi:MAG: DUF6270 domain-containing protein [Phenylobacterium sp.]|uniref:DUF6270 domain-containing protein n=1 Tax=Phenylobacterium sp. TaxID=1871053 RepID=UPI0027341949|nr:DUF6270 domain-containing protein [Phenylobacterium sp.]MDP3749232.1 DUF6270 domain-containing protein [Phenylobacterium sp.]